MAVPGKLNRMSCPPLIFAHRSDSIILCFQYCLCRCNTIADSWRRSSCPLSPCSLAVQCRVRVREKGKQRQIKFCEYHFFFSLPHPARPKARPASPTRGEASCFIRLKLLRQLTPFGTRTNHPDCCLLRHSPPIEKVFPGIVSREGFQVGRLKDF